MFGKTFVDIIDSLKNIFINKIVKYVWCIKARVLAGLIQKNQIICNDEHSLSSGRGNK